MALTGSVNFYGRFTNAGTGATGLTVTATIKKITRGSTQTITTVTTTGGVTVGSVSELDSTNAKGVYVVGVAGLDPTADYIGAFHTAGTVDQADVPALQSEFSPTINAGAIPQVASGAVGGMPLAVDSSGRVDVLKVNGTSQTARDLGASVLLSPGTGTGQLDLTSGVAKSNLVQILGTAITETAGQIAAAFKQFFNVATPTGTVNSLPNAPPAANGGLPTVDANNNIHGVQPGTGTGQLSITSGAVTVGTNNDKTGYTASTVSDKTGYSLTQAFPSNFSTFSIDGSGRTLLQPTQTGVTIPTITNLTNAPTDTSGTTTLLSRIPGTVAAQSGDAYARLGAPAGASISADIASRLAASSYTAPDNSDVASALADLVTLLGRSDPTTAIAAIQTTANAIKSQTDKFAFDGSNNVKSAVQTLPAAPSGYGGGGGAVTIEQKDITIS